MHERMSALRSEKEKNETEKPLGPSPLTMPADCLRKASLALTLSVLRGHAVHATILGQALLQVRQDLREMDGRTTEMNLLLDVVTIYSRRSRFLCMETHLSRSVSQGHVLSFAAHEARR